MNRPAIATELMIARIHARAHPFESMSTTEMLSMIERIGIADEFRSTVQLNKNLLTGTSASINGAMFNDREELFEYLAYHFDKNDRNTASEDSDTILKFVEKFYQNLLPLIKEWKQIFLCNENQELVFVINGEQHEKIENDVGPDFKMRPWESLSVVIQPKTVLNYNLQYEKRFFGHTKSARKA